MIGKTLGHYFLLALLGKGGMGEVYKAKDQKLERDVAIKVLPEEFAKDADRVARFQREAKLLASLNHPNIAAIHGLEESDGTHFLVLELIEGNTLADRIKSGPISVEESLKLALQIVEALEAAHEKGVIHRDLKPANIKVTPDGKVKILDFGLAKAFAGEQADLNLSDSPTLSQAATMQGVILGTAAYMSPEQAKGKTVDKRTDVWAFGVVLYEMLTSQSVFAADDVSQTLARVLEREPDFSTLPQNLHIRIREMLERCLQKDPKNRYSGIGDARFDIQRVLADSDGLLIRPVTGLESTALRSKLPWIVATALTAGLIFVLSARFLFKSTPALPVQRIPFTLPETQSLPHGADGLLALHPDGQKLVYRVFKDNDYKLYLRNLSQFNFEAIPETEGAGLLTFFSTDGRWLAFTIGTTLMKASMEGGSPVRIAQLPSSPRGGSWTSGDMIIIGMRNLGLMKVSANGGDPEVILSPTDNRQYWYPQVLPGGNSMIFTASDPKPEAGDVMLFDFDSEEPRTLIPNAVAGCYVPTGHIIFVRGGDIWAVGFDLGKNEIVGEQSVIIQDVRVEVGGAVQMAVASSGTLAYIPSDDTTVANRTLGLVDRNGIVEYLNVPPKSYLAPRFSPDGSRIAVYTDSNDVSNIWIYELSGETQIRQLTQANADTRPIWTPDGERITFASNRDGKQGIFWRPADGSGAAERLTTAEEGVEHLPESWSPDGDTLSFSVIGGVDNMSIWTLSPDREAQPELFYDSSDMAGHSVFSPDGKWLAYNSNESGSWEIYIQPFPSIPEVKYPITQNSGTMPLWSPDGTELFYRGHPTAQTILKSVKIRTEPTFSWTSESIFPIDDYFIAIDHRSYDIGPDGERFVMVFPIEEKDEKQSNPAQINIVLNWFEELRERVPVD